MLLPPREEVSRQVLEEAPGRAGRNSCSTSLSIGGIPVC